jgi:hypothetical protein
MAFKEIVVPSEVEKIGSGAFKGCTTLERVQIQSNSIEISDDCFLDCINLKRINLETATSIGVAAFKNCSSLLSVHIGRKAEVSDEAFMNCTSLIYIVFEKRAWWFYLSIGAKAFYNTNFKKIYIPKGTRFIGQEAFMTNESNAKIYCESLGWVTSWDINWYTGKITLITGKTRAESLVED